MKVRYSGKRVLLLSKKILIVDDEKNIVDILKFNLKKEGFATIEAYDGEQALNMALSQKPDLILLDIMLPKMDGFTVCRKIRQTSSVPILMLTAKEEELDKVLGLELGADDYITKPFSPRELMARIKANLRRVVADDMEKITGNIMERGNLIIDIDR
jgi:two-component system, OmpR family, response regulator VicR